MLLRGENMNYAKIVADLKIKNDYLSNKNSLLNSKLEE